MFAVERAAVDGGVDAEDRAERGHGPVGAEGEPGPGVEQPAESVRRRAALGADAAFGPAAVVDRVVGLHRWNDAQFLETSIILRPKVLGVLDAKAAVARGVLLDDLGED